MVWQGEKSPYLSFFMIRDEMGNIEGRDYSTMILDPVFERRLKAFDDRLKLMFDQNKKRWVILEWSPAYQQFNHLITAEDENGNPKPLGEWVFNQLFVSRHNHEVKMKDSNQFFSNLVSLADTQKEMIESKSRAERIYKQTQNINQWRKAWRQATNRPVSDVTAGYPKHTYKKGEIVCSTTLKAV